MLPVKFEIAWNYKGQRGKEVLFHTAIGSFITGMSNWAPAFRSIIDNVLEPHVKNQWDTAGQGRWQQITDQTARRKGHNTVLYETGRAYQSFFLGSPDHVQKVGRGNMVWGSKVPDVLFHQTGTGKGFQKRRVKTGPGTGPGMPMRKILDFTETDRRQMRSIFVQRLATIARREGFRVSGSGIDPLTARLRGQSILDSLE